MEPDKVSYKSPYYADLAASAGQRYGLPNGLLPAIVTRGERSNADQESSAGAKTVFQIIPATREAALKKWGVDPYLSPENAADVAARLLKESLDRNKGSAPLAVAEYVGGTDPKQWGPTTRAYVQRVTGTPLAPASSPDVKQSTFDRIQAASVAASTPSIANVVAAYKAGTMDPESKAEFEADVAAGKIMLPRGVDLGIKPAAKAAPVEAKGGMQAPAGVIEAYQSGRMTPDERAEFEGDVAAGRVTVPQGVEIAKPKGRVGNFVEGLTIPAKELVGAGEAALAMGTGVASAVGGTAQGIIDAARAGQLGTQEGVQTAQATAKANIESGTYQPRTEAGQALTKAAGAVAEPLAAIGPMAVTGEVAQLAQRAKPVVAQAVDAVQSRLPQAAARAAGGDAGAIDAAAQAAAAEGNKPHVIGPPAILNPEGAPAPVIPEGKPHVIGPPATLNPAPSERLTELTIKAKGTPDTTVPGPDGKPVTVPGKQPEFLTDAERAEMDALLKQTQEAASAAPAAPAGGGTMSAEELAATARKASAGGIGSAKHTETLAKETAPDAPTVKAMDDLGFHYQPDHVTTNQAYRELAQAVKSVPGSETRAAELQALEHNAGKADEIITQLGGTHDLSALNAGVRDTLGKAYASAKAKAQAIFKDIESRIDPVTPTPATDTVALLNERARQLGGADKLSAGERSLLADLTEEGKQPTYAFIDGERKALNEAKYNNQSKFGSTDARARDQLIEALRADQGRIAQALGAGDSWEAANAATRVYKGIQADLITLFGKQLEGSIVGNLKNAVGTLSQGDVSRFVKLIQVIPKDMRQEVVASGLSSAFGKNARNGSINFNSYAKWFEGLQKNKVARDALFSNLPPEAVTSLTNLYKAAKGISMATRERITTGRIQAVSEELLKGDTLMGHVFNVAKKAGALEAVGSALGLPGAGTAAAIASALTKGRTSAMRAADALVNSPEFIAAARKASQQNIARLARSKGFTRFMRESKGPQGTKERERWIVGALQAKGKEKK